MAEVRIFLMVVLWTATAAFAKTDRFVWTNSPDPRAPFTNWTTAARTIQEAVDVSADGDTIIVANGACDVAAVSNKAAAMAGKPNYPGVGSYDGFNDTNAPFDGISRTYRVTVQPIPE